MILGISFDTVEANRAFAEKLAYPFRLLCDPEKTTAATYDVDDPSDPGYPLRLSFLIGSDRRIIKVYDVTDTAGHAADVLADLE